MTIAPQRADGFSVCTWSAPPSRRVGVTLFELMLVLALLVLIFAISWPAIEGSFDVSRLRTGGDEVRAALGKVRLEAMRTGVIHAFRYEPSADKYQTERWSGTVTADDPNAFEDQEATGGAPSIADSGELPEGITFLSGQQITDARAVTAGVSIDQSGSASGEWPTLLFYPDGTATDAVLILKNEGGLYVRVALRGLTGIARVSVPLTDDELLENQ